MRIIIAVILAVVVGGLVGGLASFFVPFLGPLNWLVPTIILFFVFRKALDKKPKDQGLPGDFNASYAHENIAIDTASGRLWLREGSGYSRVFHKSEILRWVLVHDIYRGNRIRNALEVHVRDLDRPMLRVPFQRHGDTWKWNAARNAQEAEEWVSRLTTWMNNT